MCIRDRDKTDHSEKIFVYDLGGGTFDVSILELGDGVFEVLSTNGDTHLGGDDFDQKIIDYIANDFKSQYGIDLRNDKSAVQRLKEAAEKAKIELSSSMQTNINLPFITADATGPKHIDMNLTRAKFNELTHDLVQRSICTDSKSAQWRQTPYQRQDRRGNGDSYPLPSLHIPYRFP